MSVLGTLGQQPGRVTFSGLNGNASSLPQQVVRRSGMYVKILPEILADGANGPLGEDLFLHITKARLGLAMTSLLERCCCSNKTVVRFVLPGVGKWGPHRSIEAMGRDRGNAQDVNCLAGTVIDTPLGLKPVLQQHLYQIDDRLFERGPNNAENLLMKLLLKNDFICIPLDFRHIYADLWPIIFGEFL